MDEFGPRRRGHFGVCTAESCTDLIFVKKSGLCSKHYYRLKDYGRLTILTKTAPCLRCKTEMHLTGSAAAAQLYCCEKCSAAAERQKRKSLETAESRSRDISYRYAWRLKAKYGMTVEEYQTLLKIQNHRCAICSRAQEDTKDGYLVVDHDHNGGAWRGLLCRPCNAAIGGLGDSPELLRAAAEYLEKGRDRNAMRESTDHELQVVAA